MFIIGIFQFFDQKYKKSDNNNVNSYLSENEKL